MKSKYYERYHRLDVYSHLDSSKQINASFSPLKLAKSKKYTSPLEKYSTVLKKKSNQHIM